MMRPADVRQHLHLLNLSPAEAATLLGVGLRTVRRWTAPDEQGEAEPIPGAAEAALRAWLKLHRLGQSWRPDASALTPLHPLNVAAQKANYFLLQGVLARVRARRGPATQWDVDLERCRATLGKMTVSFYLLPGGSFTPQSFRRSDGMPIDLQRDQALLDDAFACIAAKLAAQVHEPRILLALDDPEFSLAWGDVIELWDRSLSPAVVISLGLNTLREAFDLSGADDAALLHFVRANKMALTHLAEERFLRGFFSEAKIDDQLPPVYRQIELDVRDLRPMAARLQRASFTTKPLPEGTE